MTTRVLLLSTLFPNSIQPGKGQFVRERLRQLRARHDLTWQVIAPVPWFPLTHDRFGAYGEFARVPAREQLDDDLVLHPRYAQIPRVGDAVSPLSYARSVARCIRRHGIEFDVIDAHFFFPDGVAATLLARQLGKPVAITARGSDINLMPDEVAAGRWIRWAARHCDRLIAVSDGLATRLETLSGGRQVIRAPNGVDVDRFKPGDRQAIRDRLGLAGQVVLSAGNLIGLKGHHVVLEAISGLPGVHLVIAGDGPWRAHLEALAANLGMADRVTFVGRIEQAALTEYYTAADLLVLASSNEGSPNVVLEALACGTPVVSTVAALEPDCASQQDVRLAERSASAVQAAVQSSLADHTDRQAVRTRALQLGWDRTCATVAGTLEDLASPPVEAAA